MNGMYKQPGQYQQRYAIAVPTLSEESRLPAEFVRRNGIRGLTDRAPEFARIGELRKGAKKVSDRQPGKDLGPVFRFTSDSQETADRFMAIFGHEPREIEVYLPYQTADDVFMACKEHWVAGGLVHRCDGVTCSVWRGQDGKMHTEPAPCPGQCKETGRLKVIVKELGRLGLVTALTTSKHDIMRLTEQLRAYETMRGDLRGIPFLLSRRKVMVSTPMPDGKRARREKWLLSIEPTGNWVQAQLKAMELAAFPVTSEPPMLMAPDEDEVAAQLGEPAPEWEDDDDDGVTVDAETGEITPNAPATPPPAPAANGNGNGKAKPDRPALEARLGEIVGQLAALGQDVAIDEAWLAGASDAELIAEGKRLAGLLVAAKAAQAALPMDGAA